MDINKFTEKSVSALQEAQSIAARNSNQAVDQEHLLIALCQDENGLIPQLLTNMGIDTAQFMESLERAVDRIPKVTMGGGAQGQVFISQDLNRAF
ncbi:MAG: type VI secretion system ATPase TssH, partial [Ruminococcus sp.]|nr:type VI secretion system ATPase TssH [Ruminococcus sp.]